MWISKITHIVKKSISRPYLNKDAQQLPEFLFTLVNLMKKLDAQNAAKTMLREVDVTTIPADLPTDEDVINDANKTKNGILQYTTEGGSKNQLVSSEILNMLIK